MSQAPDSSTAEQLIDLEVKLAYQDRLLGELSALVRGLVARVEAAERQLRELGAPKPGGPAPAPLLPADERPPHY